MIQPEPILINLNQLKSTILIQINLTQKHIENVVVVST